MERSLKQFEEDRVQAARIAARLLLASATTSPRVGGVGECTVHIIDDKCDIEDLCQTIEEMSELNEGWKHFKRDAAMLRDADAVLILTSLRSKTDPADINCNMCGHLTCDNLRNAERLPREPGFAFPGPLCIFRANNIAYAVDRIISLAKYIGIDYALLSAGAAAMRMKLVPKDTGLPWRGHIRHREEPLQRHTQALPRDQPADQQDRIISRLWPQFRSIYS